MKIHLYDYLNKNKKAIIDGADFTGVEIGHTIDDFSSLSLSFVMADSVSSVNIQGFDNIYIEDDNGDIIFGGIIAGYNVKPTGGTLNAYDHRWILSKLILDEAVDLTATDDVLDVVDQLITFAKTKRAIPIDFDRDGSDINTDYRANLRFEIGDDIGGSLQKIIQTIYARWQMRYYKNGNEIYGNLVIRSVKGVSPEGVGISRSKFQSEDGKEITLFYGEGDNRSNLLDFNFVFDLSSYISRVKIGVKIDDVSQFYDADPDPTSSLFEYYFGRTEGFTTDYKVASELTAKAQATINQTYPRQDLDVTLTPTFTDRLNCGDRVNVVIDSPLLKVPYGTISARIDAVYYSMKDGYLERRLFVNTMSPQKRTGTTGFLQAISDIQQKLDGLNKNYFNSTSS